jgi:hypothetical protein
MDSHERRVRLSWFNPHVKNPIEGAPSGAVAGLSDILLALGDELRKANHKVGEYSYPTPSYSGDEIKVVKEPILFLAGATVELAVSVTASGTGGVRVWVINAEGSTDYERSGKITVQLNTGAQLPVGM